MLLDGCWCSQHLVRYSYSTLSTWLLHRQSCSVACLNPRASVAAKDLQRGTNRYRGLFCQCLCNPSLALYYLCRALVPLLARPDSDPADSYSILPISFARHGPRGESFRFSTRPRTHSTILRGRVTYLRLSLHHSPFSPSRGQDQDSRGSTCALRGWCSLNTWVCHSEHLLCATEPSALESSVLRSSKPVRSLRHRPLSLLSVARGPILELPWRLVASNTGALETPLIRWWAFTFPPHPPSIPWSLDPFHGSRAAWLLHCTL